MDKIYNISVTFFYFIRIIHEALMGRRKMDSNIIDRYLEGDKEAFEDLIIEYRESAIAFAKQYTKDSYLAEDMVQEAFAYVYVYRDRYNKKYSFKTYLYTIIKNKSIDYIRKNSRLSSLDENIEVAATKDLEEEIILKEEKETLKDCLQIMKKEYREIIYLYEYEELSQKEIASILNMSLPMVKVTLFRARKKLKELYLKGGKA